MFESSYPAVEFPILKLLRHTTKDEAKTYFEWFLSIIPARMRIIERDVQTLLADWKADFSELSIEKLGEWLKAKASYRTVTLEERKSIIQNNALSGLAAQLTMEMTKTLTEETQARCFDLAIYFAESIRHNVANCRWAIEKRNNMDFHAPILVRHKNVPKKFVPLNPEPVAQAMANGMLKGDSERSILTRYLKWKDMFTRGYQEPSAIK